MSDVVLADKRVLIRADLNVPLENGEVVSDRRIRASIATINAVLKAGGIVILLSHLGRPKEGEFSDKFSLAPVADRLSGMLGREVRLVRNWLNGIEAENGDVVLCENVRFSIGESENCPKLSKRIADLADVFVMDAFGTAHRAQASTEGVAKFAQVACAGPLLINELAALRQALEKPDRPVVAIVGGAKVSTKLSVLASLSNIVDQLIPGGGIANTFLAAAGHNVGNSLFEEALIPTARCLLAKIKERGKVLPLPLDVVVAKSCSASEKRIVKRLNEISGDDLILDVGPETSYRYSELVDSAGTIVWNGPVGVFELEPFSEGTRRLASAIADSKAFSIAGGGDTLAAVEKYKVESQISYLSTGGGAFLEFLEGRQLPAVSVLEERAVA